MTTVGVVTDSTADLQPALQERLGLGVVPLIINWDGKTAHGVEIPIPALHFNIIAFYEPSMVTPVGEFNLAEVAGPPSPAKPGIPTPAAVLMSPFGVTLRMR